MANHIKTRWATDADFNSDRFSMGKPLWFKGKLLGSKDATEETPKPTSTESAPTPTPPEQSLPKKKQPRRKKKE
jgi:hypothetical protein